MVAAHPLRYSPPMLLEKGAASNIISSSNHQIIAMIRAKRAPLGEGAEQKGRCRIYKTTDAALDCFGSPQQLLLNRIQSSTIITNTKKAVHQQ
jgi:hypothetical protein